MVIGHQLAVLGESIQWSQLPFRPRLIVDVVENLRFEDEVSSVDPALTDLWAEFPSKLWLLREPNNAVAVHLQSAEPIRRMHCGQRRESTMRAVEFEQFPEIHVGDAIPVCEHERLAAEKRGDPLDARSRFRLGPGLYEVDGPVLRDRLNRGSRPQAAVPHVDGDI